VLVTSRDLIALVGLPRFCTSPRAGLRRTQGPLRGNGRRLWRRFSSPWGRHRGLIRLGRASGLRPPCSASLVPLRSTNPSGVSYVALLGTNSARAEHQQKTHLSKCLVGFSLASPRGLAAPPNRGRRCALAAAPRPFFGPDPGLRRTQGPLRDNGRRLRRRFSSPWGRHQTKKPPQRRYFRGVPTGIRTPVSTEAVFVNRLTLARNDL